MNGVTESWAATPGRRRIMQGNRGRDTKPELALRSILHRRGLRYRANFRPLPGVRNSADVVFTRAKVAVFVDGCFWHGCPEHFKEPSRNPEYWGPKIAGNRRRDEEFDALLLAAGWQVVRAWEHADPVEVADLVERAVRGAEPRTAGGR